MKVKKLLVAAASLALASVAQAAEFQPPTGFNSPPRAAQPAPALLANMDDHWAVDGYCTVPSKSYTAKVDENYQRLTWQDGLGNVYVERVIFSEEHEFRTMAVFSRNGKNAYGTGWIYSNVHDFLVVHVIKSNGKSFDLVRCTE
jgi:hypothetical protein